MPRRHNPQAEVKRQKKQLQKEATAQRFLVSNNPLLSRCAAAKYISTNVSSVFVLKQAIIIRYGALNISSSIFFQNGLDFIRFSPSFYKTTSTSST